MGEDGFEPSKHSATDLQSAPFGHSGTLPYLIFWWSRWTDSNPRPADYKSAALPTELHRHRCFFATVLYYHNRAGMSSLFLKFPEIFLSRSAAFRQIPEKSGANFPRRLFCQKLCSGFYLWALWEPSTISAELITASEFPTTAALTRPSDII